MTIHRLLAIAAVLIAGAATIPAIAGDFDVSSSNSTVSNPPPPPPPPQPAHRVSSVAAVRG